MDRPCRFSLLQSMITLACQKVFLLNRQLVPTEFREKENNLWILVWTSFRSYKGLRHSKLIICKIIKVFAERIRRDNIHTSIDKFLTFK
jgi:hypothetical protein